MSAENEMEAGIERRENAKLVPDAYGITGEAFEEVHEAMNEYAEHDPTLWLRLALKEDGTPTAYYEITVDGESVYCGNDVFNCPPVCP